MQFESNPGCDAATIRAWEAKHGVTLPSDLASFYSELNGLDFKWAVGRFTLTRLEDLGADCHIEVTPAGKVR